mmetsp:Transcript_5442/g.13437  ORF Transcript_5442/g.13437 Transcript_5442/m.13437 type:complete len:200 (+) Transcript_5442:65-664(+)
MPSVQQASSIMLSQAMEAMLACTPPFPASSLSNQSSSRSKPLMISYALDLSDCIVPVWRCCIMYITSPTSMRAQQPLAAPASPLPLLPATLTSPSLPAPVLPAVWVLLQMLWAGHHQRLASHHCRQRLLAALGWLTCSTALARQRRALCLAQVLLLGWAPGWRLMGRLAWCWRRSRMWSPAHPAPAALSSPRVASAPGL